jgi:hypothetical protein
LRIRKHQHRYPTAIQLFTINIVQNSNPWRVG